ncbi:MAG: ChbG/HpnK family deacetylase [Fimbriimonadaceae bacterium]|nr:ChbG/HpnK family deacetylase [Fimbriimonadaceae bacterium]
MTRADDGGSCLSANEAVRAVVEGGIVRNVSVMVPAPTFRELAPWLAEVRGVDVGVHLTMNAEWERVKWGPCAPLDRVQPLADQDGLFLSTTAALHERGDSVIEPIVTEARAQVALARSLGIEVAYLDDHMGFTWLPGVRSALEAFGHEIGIPTRFGGLTPWPSVPGESSTEDAEAMVTRFLALVSAAPEGTYLWVTHPGFDREDMRAFTLPDAPAGRIAREREADRRFWLSPRLREAVASGSFAPGRFSDIG